MSNTPNLGLKNDHINGDPLEAGWVNAVADDLDAAHAATATATISVGAEVSNVVQVTVQVKNLAGNNWAAKHLIHAWLVDSNDAMAALCTTAPSGGWSAGTGRLHRTYTTNKDAAWLSNASGAVRIDIGESTAKTFYLVVEVGGKLVLSGAITFA